MLDNPSVGNYEELGDLYLDDGQFARARDCFDRVIARRESIDPLYRRALCANGAGRLRRGTADLEQVVIARDPKYDYQRAAGLLAHAFAKAGEREKADALFAEVTETSTLSETAVQLRRLSRRRGPGRRGARMGRAHPAKEGDDARLHSPPRAAVVSKGRCAAQAAAVGLSIFDIHVAIREPQTVAFAAGPPEGGPDGTTPIRNAL